MAKAVKQSAVAVEIKKEFLMQHLELVERLLTEWIGQLNAPGPFSVYKGMLGWQSAYKPKLETEPDNNHILRSHVRSRALWRHHTDLELKIALAWSLVAKLREMTTGQLPLGKGDNAAGILKSYIGTALLAAFEAVRRSKLVSMNYKAPDDGIGVACGDFKIDNMVATREQRRAVQEKHRGLAIYLAEQKSMRQLVDCCQKIENLEQRMIQLATKTLKSRDILYPCRFCRHLWR